jgi:hypothetical protein
MKKCMIFFAAALLASLAMGQDPSPGPVQPDTPYVLPGAGPVQTDTPYVLPGAGPVQTDTPYVLPGAGPPRAGGPNCFEFTLTLIQERPGGFLNVIDSCGGMDHHFVNLVTTVRTGFPNGPLYGLDMTVEDALQLVSLGAPFFGQLDQNGSFTYVLRAPLPPGLVLYCVALELSRFDYSLLAVSAPIAYMIR